MSQLEDYRGVSTTVANTTALDLYEKALQQLQSYKGDPVETADAAIAEDPNFVMAHCLKAHCGCIMADGQFKGHIEETLESARAAVEHGNDRERGHFAAIEAWHSGNFQNYANTLESVLVDNPRDILALQVAHLGDFYLGDAHNLRDRVARVLSAYDKDTPGYGYALGMYSFGLEECNEYTKAEEVGRKAVEISAGDVWAIHAVAHVLEMQGRQLDGIDWYESRVDDWAPDNEFATHNWWHLALYYLDLQNMDKVLEIFDSSIANGSVALELLDASALLWRLHLTGFDVSNRFDTLADRWESTISYGGYYCFNDCHAIMAFVGSDRNKQAQSMLEKMESVANGTTYSAKMAQRVGLPVAKSIIAFGAGKYNKAVELLAPIRYTANFFGGSHAQRDLISQTLIESAIRAGQFQYARALLSERAAKKDTTPLTWQNTAKVLGSLNLANEANAANERAKSLLERH